MTTSKVLTSPNGKTNNSCFKLKPVKMTAKHLWIFVILIMLATQTEGWRRRRRRRCPRTNCAVTSFNQWSSCSQPCGNGGTQTRTRTVTRRPSCGGSSCPPLRETRACNRGCSNGGFALTGRCLCKSGYGGQCCTRGKINLLQTIPESNNSWRV